MELNNWKTFEIYYKNEVLNFLQTEFWRKVIIHPYDDENLWNNNLLRTSLMSLLALLDIVEDQID